MDQLLYPSGSAEHSPVWLCLSSPSSAVGAPEPQNDVFRDRILDMHQVFSRNRDVNPFYKCEAAGHGNVLHEIGRWDSLIVAIDPHPIVPDP